MFSLFEWTGNKALCLIRYIVNVGKLTFGACAELMSWNRKGRKVISQVLLRQIVFTGVDAIPMISVISLLLGTIVITQAFTQLPVYGGESYIGNVIVSVIIRELGPLITAIVVIGRSGSAIATELGLMGINHEVEALEAMGISKIRVIVLPRVLGSVIAIICLTVYFDLLAILGGFIISSIQLTTPFYLYLHRIFLALQVSDIVLTLIKSAMFGFVIAILSSYHGLKVKQYILEVPQATTKAVISSLVVCFFFSSALTMIFYL